MPPTPHQPPLRLRRPNRQQVTPVPLYLDALLPDDHLARLIWAAVERLDLCAFTAEIKVVEGGPGRAAADPAVLVPLWVYATSQGESSARRIARLCTEHFAYLWLCGGVSMNYHSLADFRVAHGPSASAAGVPSPAISTAPITLVLLPRSAPRDKSCGPAAGTSQTVQSGS